MRTKKGISEKKERQKDRQIDERGRNWKVNQTRIVAINDGENRS